ncbi:MAG TPA: Gfo/Idh/MocA family oxidoreductase [Stellaceae bacterium]|nr:Gfo/Idh/MocA family oxidoreductase [Stellaceae bacterium]
MRIGIIGCGLIGRKRAAAARGHEITLVYDRDPAAAAALAKTTGATVAQSAEALIGADLDVIIIATAHDALPVLATRSVEAGKHVLVEKPAGRNAAEVAPVAAAAARHNRIVKVGFNHRFHPAVLKAHAIVSSGSVGPLLYIRGRYGHGGRVGYEKEWRCVPEISGGGELVDQGSHLIDLSRWFLGELTLEYAATPTYFWDIPVDDNAFLALRGESGRMAWLHASWTEWKNMFSMEIYGRVGKLVIDGLGGSYGTERLTLYQMHPEMGPPETTTWEFPFPDRSWDLEFAEFAAAIAEGRRPCGDIGDALAMHHIIDKAYGRGNE